MNFVCTALVASSSQPKVVNSRGLKRCTTSKDSLSEALWERIPILPGISFSLSACKPENSPTHSPTKPGDKEKPKRRKRRRQPPETEAAVDRFGIKRVEGRQSFEM